MSKDGKDYTRTILPIADRYHEIVTTWAGYKEEWNKENTLDMDEDAEWIPVPRNKIEDEPELLPIRTEPKIGRNDPCLCGSGKKYKKCHMNA